MTGRAVHGLWGAVWLDGMVMRMCPQERLTMSRALTVYFVFIGVVDTVGAWLDWLAGGITACRAVSIAVWFALAAGLYGKYRAARIAGIGICTIAAGAGIIWWLASGFQHYLFLLAAIVFGLPLVGLLHPKARTEFVRKIGTASRPTDSEHTD